MKTSILIFTYLLLSMAIFGQQNKKDTVTNYKFSVSTPWLTFNNFGPEKTNTHHYEFHFGYQITPKDKIGIKVTDRKSVV